MEELIEVREKLVPIKVPYLRRLIFKPTRVEGIGVMKYMEAKEYEVFSIDNMSNGDWRRPIMEYMENLVQTMDQKVKYRPLSYTIMGNEWFKNTP